MLMQYERVPFPLPLGRIVLHVHPGAHGLLCPVSRDEVQRLQDLDGELLEGSRVQQVFASICLWPATEKEEVTIDLVSSDK